MLTTIGFIGESLKIISFNLTGRHKILIIQAFGSSILALFWYLIKELVNL